MVGDMSGALKFKDWKALNESNQTPINPEGSLTYDWRKGGGKRRIKKAMRGNKGSGNGRANFGFLPTNNY